jgi:CDP-glycerol glycerophosphotransferase
VPLAAGEPVLSVIVPVFNVADYLGECLDSIVAQPFQGVHVIVVDDGSSDGSAELAREYADRHPNFEFFEQPNSGVSIARNNAIERVRTPYLTFVDPDDVLPADAWSTMFATLRETGSDFVVGAVERLEGERRYQTPSMVRTQRLAGRRQTIDAVPLMLTDVFVWNKIFVTDFWREAGITFPERTRYQDQVALTDAYLKAESFDVIDAIVYEWRHRPSANSATQTRRTVTNLQERINTKRMTLDFVEAYDNPQVTWVLETEILPVDMWEYCEAVPGCTDEFWDLLVSAFREFWGGSRVAYTEAMIPPHERLMGWLVTEGRREDLVALFEWFPTLTEAPIKDDLLVHPWFDEPGMPLFREVRYPDAAALKRSLADRVRGRLRRRM